jgi:hypothetical protein
MRLRGVLLRSSCLILGFWAALPARAQLPVPADSSQSAAKLRTFLDCNFCDFDFMRTEIGFVDYVRDRQDADVDILVTDQPTGGGGTEYTLHFIGLRAMTNLGDTLKYVSPPGESPDDLRHGLARTIKLGLVRYYAHQGQAARFDVSYNAPAATGQSAKSQARDRWHLWVFRTNLSGYGSGEKSSNFGGLNGSVNANRTTALWKTVLTVSGSYSQNRFTLSDGSRFNTYSHSYGLSDLVVKSLGAHWSAGQRASWTSSTFLNQSHAIRFAPAIEFNVFPYSQSTRRMLTLQYSTGINFFRYQDTTIFDKIKEVRGDQTLITSLDLKQPWGSVSASLEGAAYLNDFNKRHLVLFNSLDLHLFKGFSFFSFGQLSLIRDQLYLPRGDLSDEERLLRQRQLATSYTYFVNLGLSYSFGSIFNNIVNPRFGGTSGGFTIIN